MISAQERLDSALAVARARWAKQDRKLNSPAPTTKVTLTPAAHALIDKSLPPQPRNGTEAVDLLRRGYSIRLPTKNVMSFFRWIDKRKDRYQCPRCRCEAQGDITVMTPMV